MRWIHLTGPLLAQQEELALVTASQANPPYPQGLGDIPDQTIPIKSVPELAALSRGQRHRMVQAFEDQTHLRLARDPDGAVLLTGEILAVFLCTLRLQARYPLPRAMAQALSESVFSSDIERSAQEVGQQAIQPPMSQDGFDALLEHSKHFQAVGARLAALTSSVVSLTEAQSAAPVEAAAATQSDSEPESVDDIIRNSAPFRELSAKLAALEDHDPAEEHTEEFEERSWWSAFLAWLTKPFR